jgi:hypothetical protein
VMANAERHAGRAIRYPQVVPRRARLSRPGHRSIASQEASVSRGASMVPSGTRASVGGCAVWSCPSWTGSVVERMMVSPVAGGAMRGPVWRISPATGVLVATPPCPLWPKVWPDTWHTLARHRAAGHAQRRAFCCGAG